MTTSGDNTTNDQRKLGFWMCTALVVGNTIGIGIFLLPSSLAPFGFNAMIGWFVTVLGCMALARVFARLAREMPNADGPYGYIRTTLGEIPAFLAIWCYWVSLWITNAAIATGVVGYLGAVFPAIGKLQPALVALALLWSFVVINLFGVRTGGRVQVVTTALKLLPMVAVALLGAWLLLTSPAIYTSHLPTTPLRLGDVMTASTIALFAMLGLESATVPAARVENPARTIPRATMAGTVLTAVDLHHCVVRAAAADPATGAGQRQRTVRDADGPLRRRGRWSLAGAVRRGERPGRAQWLDPSGGRTDTHDGRQRRDAGDAFAQQPPRRAGNCAAGDGPAGQRDDRDELQQVAGR